MELSLGKLDLLLAPSLWLFLQPPCDFHHQIPHYLSIFDTCETLLQKGSWARA